MCKSNSCEQQEAEKYIAEQAQILLKCELQKSRLDLAENVTIEPDLFSEEHRIVCEIFAHIGKVKTGQQHKISQDILKLILLEKCYGEPYQKILLIADKEVEAYLKGRSFIAESIRRFHIKVIRIDLPDDIREMIMLAQQRQFMRNL